MRAIRHAIRYACVGAWLALLPGSAAAQQRTAAEQYLLEAVNAARIAAGLPAVMWNDALARTATLHAQRMRNENSLSHRLEGEPDISERVAAGGVQFTEVAENVGVAPTAVDLHAAWMASPNHRGNILDPAMTSVGVGLAGAGGEVWGDEEFAKVLVSLSFEEQEKQVQELLHATGVSIVQATQAARETCGVPVGYSGVRPMFVMRYTSTDLTTLPRDLTARIALGGIARAAVGACRSGERQTFSSYQVAVLLYR